MKTHDSAITVDAEKFKELVLYVSAKCLKDPTYGTIKLNKIIFFADTKAHAEWGKPITGVEYRKYEYGPAPACMKSVKRELEQSGDAYNYKNPLPSGCTQHQLLAVRPPVLSKFSPQEIALVDGIIQDLWNQSATAVSELSHEYPGWRLATEGEEIPYYTVVIPTDPIELSDEDKSWARSVAVSVAGN